MSRFPGTADVGDRPYLLRLLRRALVFWAALRALLFALAIGAGAGPAISPLSALLLAAVVAVLCTVDARFMRETIFQANLGTPPWAPAVAAVAVALTGAVAELLLLTAGALLR